MVFSAIAIWVVAKYPITETMAGEVRAELERRRGRPGDVDASTAT